MSAGCDVRPGQGFGFHGDGLRGDPKSVRPLQPRVFDSGDGQGVADAYTADGQPVMGGKPVADGRAALLKQPRKPEPGEPSIKHLPVNISIEPTDNGAKGRSYVFLVNMDNGKFNVVNGGVYDDVLVKEADGWRFKRRTFTPFPR